MRCFQHRQVPFKEHRRAKLVSLSLSLSLSCHKFVNFVIGIVAGAMILTGGPVAWATHSPTTEVNVSSVSQPGGLDVGGPGVPIGIDLIAVNRIAYERVFVVPYGASSEFRLDSPVLGRAAYSGTNEAGMPYTFYVSRAEIIDGMNPSLPGITQANRAAWSSINLSAHLCTGLLESFLGNAPVVALVWSDTSTGDQRTTALILGTLSDDTAISLKRSATDWHVRGDAAACQALLDACQANYNDAMDSANALAQLTLGTVGIACLVGVILCGAFCLVGNPIACVCAGKGSAYCTTLLVAAIAALATAAAVASQAYNNCSNRAQNSPACQGVMFP